MCDLTSRKDYLKKINEYLFNVYGCTIDEIDDYMRGNESKAAYIVTGICDALELFEEQPTVDAKPVVHGEWIEHKWAEEVGGWLISNFECSQCHMWKRYNTNFCPECGADMRKKVK